MKATYEFVVEHEFNPGQTVLVNLDGDTFVVATVTNVQGTLSKHTDSDGHRLSFSYGVTYFNGENNSSASVAPADVRALPKDWPFERGAK